MGLRRVIVLAVCLGFAACDAFAQARSTATRPTSRSNGLPADFVAATITSSDGYTQPYAVFVPENYDRAKKWPLVMFLHGSGEGGADGVRQTRVGLGPFVAMYRKKCPFIAVFPQSPNAKTWFRGPQAKIMFEILDKVQRDYSVDPDRIYLTGISMGGFGTWEMGMMRPDLFAALIPICGGGPVEFVDPLKRMPIWCFHGARDDRVPVKSSRVLIDRLKKIGGEPKYTEFPDEGHLCWDTAYATQGLFPWMLKQRRGQPPTAMALNLDTTWCPVPTRIWWLRVDKAEKGSKQLRIEAVIASATEVRLATQGIAACSILLDKPIAKQADAPLKIIWNGRVVYEGKWKPEVMLTLDRARAATQPIEPK